MTLLMAVSLGWAFLLLGLAILWYLVGKHNR
jgi:hypothetical protein